MAECRPGAAYGRIAAAEYRRSPGIEILTRTDYERALAGIGNRSFRQGLVASIARLCIRDLQAKNAGQGHAKLEVGIHTDGTNWHHNGASGMDGDE